MEIAGEDSFRIRSYRNGATAIEGYPERIADILRNPERKVTEIPGIGKGLASVLDEIVTRGSCDRRDEMLQKFPPTALEFLKIQGLGPKSIALIFEHFRISTIDELERLCVEQKLRELPRMGAKLEEKVLRSIAQYRQRSGRYLLSYAESLATELTDTLMKTPGVESVTPAGSLRRGRETVGDLDLLVTGPEATAALETFLAFPRVEEVLSRGENKASAKVGREGLAGGCAHAAAEYLRRGHAILHGQQRPQRGDPHARGEDGSQTERIRAVPRRGRQAHCGRNRSGRIRGARVFRGFRRNCARTAAKSRRRKKHRLPELLELGDIRGDLHMHTTETDGRATLEEMAAASRERGYEYIAITDHSKALAMANGLDEKRAVAFAKQVREINRNGLGIRVFSGLECDILRDGALDLANDALAELDIVIGSVHSHMNLEAAEMTDRLLRALECPHLRMLGASDGAHSAAPRPVPVRLRAHCRGSRAARRVAGD